MKSLFRQNATFITLSLMLILALGLALFCIPKQELHLLLCDHHTAAGDLFFRYYTQVAEWFPYVLCVLILLLGRIGDGCFASACQALSALTTQIVKHILVAPRPLTWFTAHYPDIELPLTEGVKMNYWYSFPSGHTTSFFALFFVLSIMAARRFSTLAAQGIQVLLLVLAALGGYSRIYLSQHFALDVFGGAVVGMTITLVCYAIFSRFEDQKWYNYRVFQKK